jgi:hypothetical protein
MVAPALALAFLAVVSVIRIQHVEFVSWAAGGAGAALSRTPGAPTLVVPGHRNDSFEWLDETRQMFRQGQWRIHFIAYENAPRGREEAAASPFRWWLGLVAGLSHLSRGQGLVASVESAAIFGPFLLQLAFWAAATWVAWRLFGALAAAAVSAGAVVLYPLSGQFIGGVPESGSLSWILAAGSLVPLVVAPRLDAARGRRAFMLSGLAGGLGLWVNASIGMPVVAGVALGGWIALGASGLQPAEAPPIDGASWRAWGLAGAVTCLACYLLEYFPSDMGSWDLRTNHPVHGLAWLGLSELLALSRPGSGTKGRWRVGIRAGVALLAVASIPVTLHLVHGAGLLSNGLAGWHLTDAPDSATAATLGQFLEAKDIGFVATATLLPLALVLPAVILILRKKAPAPARAGLALALGPVLVAAALTSVQIRWFSGVDAALLVLLLPLAGAAPRSGPTLWGAVMGFLVVLLPGAILDWPPPVQNLDDNDLVSIIERDLAGMLARRSVERGAIVLAPPNATNALYYYGGLRGLATLNWQNTEGLGVAVRIVSALTPEEAQALISERQVGYLILPQWDPFIDAFARIGQGETEGTFLERLHNWVLPAWLRPVPYVMPTIPGFANQSVVILEVVDEQETAVAASRLAEYFVDMGNAQLAENAAQALRRFPADLGALLARTQVAIATGQTEEFKQLSETLVRRAQTGADRTLAWDQKVALSVVLAQARQITLAKAELERCLASITERDLRELSVNELYRLQILKNALGLEIKDKSLRTLALSLLPPDVSSQLERRSPE